MIVSVKAEGLNAIHTSQPADVRTSCVSEWAMNRHWGVSMTVFICEFVSSIMLFEEVFPFKNVMVKKLW